MKAYRTLEHHYISIDLVAIPRVVKRGGLAWNRLGPLLTWPITILIELRAGYKLGQQYRLVEP